jgi:DNA-binding response OmpR family regulator
MTFQEKQPIAPKLQDIDYHIQRIGYHLQQIVILRSKENVTVLQPSPESDDAEIPLQFNDANRTILWYGGKIRLSEKRYLFVKTLWTQPNHEAEIETIAETVWQTDDFVPQNTIRVTVSRTNNFFETKQFPYRIYAVKTADGQCNNGYRLG